MINEEKQVCYNMQVYNDFVDFPFAMTNIEDFEFDKLLSHPNPEVRAFNFILITKCTTKGNTTTVKPLMIIYNKNKTGMDGNMLTSLLIDFSCCT